MRRRSTRLAARVTAAVIGALLVASAPAYAGPPCEPNPRSDPELLSVVDAFADPHPDHLLAVPVRDVRLTGQALELSLVEGTLFAEPPVDGRHAVFYFEGRAMMRFAPSARTARDALAARLGDGRQVLDVSARRLLIVSFRERALPDELGLDLARAPMRPPADPEGYAEIRAVLERFAVPMAFLQLNRHGPARGAFFVLLPAEGIRVPGARPGHLLYSFDPTSSPEVGLYLQDLPAPRRLSDLYRGAFGALSHEHARPASFRPQARVERYRVDLRAAERPGDARMATEIVLEPVPRLAVLRLLARSDLPIVRVTDEGGRELPFMQSTKPPQRDRIPVSVVLIGLRPADRPQPERIRIETTGNAIPERWMTCLSGAVLHPLADDPRPHQFELTADLPKRRVAISSGQRFADVVSGARRRIEFRTSRPQARDMACFGEYRRLDGRADDLALEVFVDAGVLGGMQWAKTVRVEAEAAAALYGRLLGPPADDVLRLVTTELTNDMRAVGGLVPLPAVVAPTGEPYFYRLEESLLARQWWGAIVDGRDWPEDRWIVEALAEYMAMEFARLTRFDPRAYRDELRYRWRRYVPEAQRRTDGDGGTRPRLPHGHALTDGTELVVRTKGPLVIHMLRSLFRDRFDSDEPFWQMLRNLIGEGEYRRIGTEEFRRHAEQALGMPLDWFWDQWIYGTGIPTVVWHARRERTEDGWKVIVEAEQQDAEFRLLVPVYVDIRGGGVTRRMLEFEGRRAQVEIGLPKGRRPRRIELNRYFEALVELEER
ncbi:MAG: hypothetical protein Kow0062_22100 [Acidobacteriota bacterium]